MRKVDVMMIMIRGGPESGSSDFSLTSELVKVGMIRKRKSEGKRIIPISYQ